MDRLAPDGLHVERWFPKADLDGRVIDLRVVVIAGRPSHVVVRASRGPMTNLHLGGARGSTCPTCARAPAREHCAGRDGDLRTGRGVLPRQPAGRGGPDVLLRTGASHAVAEVNAFGDLLPGLLVDGRDTYAAQIAAVADRGRDMTDMNAIVGRHDLLLVTLDTLRYDVAAELAAAGRTPNLARVLPGGRWERRHTPASFTYAAHQAFFAGFLPTPTDAGPAPAAVRGDASPAARPPATDTWVFDAPDLVTGLAATGYHTVCVGGVGFFNQLSPLGGVLPGLFAESHWSPEFGVTNPTSFEAQLDRSAGIAARGRQAAVPVRQRVRAAPAQPVLPARCRGGLAGQPRRRAGVRRPPPAAGCSGWPPPAGGPCFAIVCSDHGTAYGEDGHTGHRIAHEVVWTVPYAEFILHPGQW